MSETQFSWIVSGRIFCWRFVRSTSSAGGVLCGFGHQHVFRILGCARGKQRCLTAVPNQKSISLDAGLRIKGIPALQLWDCVVEAFSYSDAEGNFARPSGKRHSQSQSIDHMSLDLFDHVPSNMPESSFCGRLYIFAGRHSYDHKRSWSSFETRVTNAPCNYS